MRDVILNVICVAFKRTAPLRILINSFIVQTNPHWRLFIIHDGPAPDDLIKMVQFYRDPRIRYQETEVVNGYWGHPNRRLLLKEMPFNHKDFILITNDDNYYVPMFVELMLQFTYKEANTPGMIYCNTLHNYTKYDVLETQVKVGRIDMGSFIVRNDIAKRVGFKYNDFEADGLYAEECAQYCNKMRLKLIHIKKALFIHN